MMGLRHAYKKSQEVDFYQKQTSWLFLVLHDYFCVDTTSFLASSNILLIDWIYSFKLMITPPCVCSVFIFSIYFFVLLPIYLPVSLFYKPINL